MRIKIFLVVLFVPILMMAQESFLEIGNTLKDFTSKVKQTYTLFDEKNNDFSIFLEDSDHVCAFYYNNKLENLASIKAKALPKKYKYFLGYSVNNLDQNLYFSNSQKSKFGLYSFNFDNNKAEEEELDLEIENETFLQSISNNNKFYLLTITNNSSILNFYSFDNKEVKRNQLDLSETVFINSKYEGVPLSKVLDTNSNGCLAKVEQNNPTPIKMAFSFSKLYVVDNNVIITVDKSDDITQIITISLNDFEFDVQSVKQPEINEETIFKLSNSFLINDFLFQIISTRNKMVLNIKDYKSKESLKRYSISKKEVLSLEKNALDNDKKGIKKTNRFLKNATVNYIGLAIYKLNDDYQIKIGSYRPQNTGGPMMTSTPGFGSFSFNPATSTVSFTPGTPIYSFNSYGSAGIGIVSNTLSETLDSDFNFLSKTHKDNVFDKARGYIEINKEEMIGETLFKYKNSLILGFYKRGTNIYKLLEFND